MSSSSPGPPAIAHPPASPILSLPSPVFPSSPAPLPPSSPSRPISDSPEALPTHLPDIAVHPSASTTSLPSRPHSPSVSSVHFADTESIQRPPTVSSSRLRHHASSPLRLSSSDQPSWDHGTSPRSHSTSTVPAPLPFDMPESDPSPSRKRSHVRPEETRPSRSGSLIAHGKRASVVTGGYESSSSSSASSSSNRQQRQRTSLPPQYTQSPSLVATGRQRAQSLMSPMSEESASYFQAENRTAVPSPKRRKASGVRQLALRPTTGSNAPSRVASQRSARSGGLPSSKSDSFFANGHASSAPSRVASLRTGQNTARAQDADPEKPRPKGKDKEARTGGLAASLGVEENWKEVALSTDQIHDLLSDTDLTSALRLLHAGPIPSPRTAYPPDPSSSTLSPPVTSRTPSPSHTQPYIVTAPPALTAHTRDRTASVASTIAPAPRTSGWTPTRERSRGGNAADEIAAAAAEHRRRRTSSRATALMDEGEGGHVPFTHHVPVIAVVEGDSSDEDAVIAAPEPVRENGNAAANSMQRDDSLRSVSTVAAGDKKDRKHRLSGIFGLRKKHDEAAKQTKPAVDETKGHAKVEKEKEREREREKDRAEKDAEMRRIEAERRDAELAQERRFRALTQVAAHPMAERAAYRAANHLRAHYGILFDSLESPPKLNPLAVLRWKHRTAEQNEARRVWEEKERAQGRDSPRKNGGDGVYGGLMHSSPNSMGSVGRRSEESSRSALLRSSPRKGGKRSPSVEGKGALRQWTYTLEDVQAYRDCGGVVNYFVPPRHVFSGDHVEELSRSRSTVASERAGRGSVVSTGDKGSVVGTVMTVGTTGTAESIMPLSRETSAERRPSTQLEHSPYAQMRSQQHHHTLHRQHHSLGTSTSLSHALRVPLQKLGNAARRRLHDDDSANEDAASPQSTHQQLGPSPLAHHTIARENGTSKTGPSLRSAKPSDTLTDEEPREHLFSHRYLFPGQQQREKRDQDRAGEQHHLRRLFLKGQRALPVPLRMDSSGSNAKKNPNRREELQALETALARERAWRERELQDDEEEEGRKRTRAEEEAKQRLEEVEREIYSERRENVRAASQRLARYTTGLQASEEGMRHYLTQIDQLIQVAKVTAEVDTVWPDLDRLRALYASSKSAISSPRPSEAFASSSEHHLPRPRQNSRRRSTLLPPQPVFSNLQVFGIRPFPRRTIAAGPDGARVDPVMGLELALRDAKERRGGVGKRLTEVKGEMEGMRLQVEALVRRKDEVRGWVKRQAERNRRLQTQVDSLTRQLRGDTSARMSRLSDALWDTLGRRIVSPVFKSVFAVFYIARWGWSLRSREARLERGKVSWRGMGWGGWIVFWVGLAVGVSWWVGG